MFCLHLWVTGVEHPYIVTVLTNNRRQGFNPDGGERHHLDSILAESRVSEFRREKPVKVFVSDINQKNPNKLSSLLDFLEIMIIIYFYFFYYNRFKDHLSIHK